MIKKNSHGINKTTISIIVAVLIFGGIVWIARPDSEKDIASSSENGGILTIEGENSYDFGAISMAKGEVSHQFKLKNTGEAAVVIEKMYTSCMCTTAALTVHGKRFGPYGMPGHGVIPKINQAIEKNEEAIVEVVFDPAAHGPAGIGRIQRVVTIENNTGQPVELQFAAVVIP